MNEPRPARRADATRNRSLIVEAAERAYTTGGDHAPGAIAREAGVGIGTLYRHFPYQNDLAIAVYDAELSTVAESATVLLQTTLPLLALRRWMEHFARSLTNKTAMAPALHSLIDGRADGPNAIRARLTSAAQFILDTGMSSGDIRAGSRGDDLLIALIGVCLATAENGDEEQRGRLLDLLGDGVAAYGSRRFGPLNR